MVDGRLVVRDKLCQTALTPKRFYTSAERVHIQNIYSCWDRARKRPWHMEWEMHIWWRFRFEQCHFENEPRLEWFQCDSNQRQFRRNDYVVRDFKAAIDFRHCNDFS